MFVAFAQSAVPRLLAVGLVVIALQNTLLLELRPLGVIMQIALTFAVVCGAVGGPQKGALAGFVLGLLFDLRAGTPIGSSSAAFGVGGYVAGASLSITIDPSWWLVALFAGLGAAVGEFATPVVRIFIGDSDTLPDRWWVAVAVVALSSMVFAPLLAPIARWTMKVRRIDWSKAVVGKADVAA